MAGEWLSVGPFAGLTTRQAQLLATGLVVVGTFALYLGIPRSLRWTVRSIGRIVRRATDSEFLESIRFPFPTVAAIWTLRAGVTVVAVASVLLIWGYQGLAERAYTRVIDALPILGSTVLSVATLVGAWILTRLIRQRLYAYTDQVEHITQHQEGVVFRITQVSVYVTAAIIVLSYWAVDLQGLLVGAGFLGIVFGMAARQTLGSLIAGFVLMFSRPFEIGDWVRIGEDQGIVTAITIVNTHVRSFDDQTIVIPNDVVANQTVHNMTDSQRLRLAFDVGVSYDTDLERARSLALEALEDLEEVLSIPKPSTVLKSFGDSSVVIEVRFWIEPATTTQRWKAQTAAIEAVKQTFDREGIEIPFPQRDLSGNIEGVRVQPEEASVERPDPPSDPSA